jgi:hypothetical protein
MRPGQHTRKSPNRNVDAGPVKPVVRYHASFEAGKSTRKPTFPQEFAGFVPKYPVFSGFYPFLDYPAAKEDRLARATLQLAAIGVFRAATTGAASLK